MTTLLTKALRSGLTGGPVATRIAAFDTGFMGLLLPNPDPILRAAGKSLSAYRDIARDSHVGACIRRRKAAVKALEWDVQRHDAPARVFAAVRDAFDALDLDALISATLDATLFGYQPLEIDWQPRSGLIVPADVQAKPPEWFCFDGEGELRFRTRSAPLEGEPLPARKFLLPRQDASYANPYGLADLALCWWPVVFKKGGMKFWLQFAEKYGSAFSVGKLPRGAEDAERQRLLGELEDMIHNGVAVIPDDGSIELLEPAGKSASAELYERLVKHCRSEISIVLTGTNQTIEVEANRASAYAGMDVAGDLRDADAEIVKAAFNQLIGWMVQINWPGAAAPSFGMWDQHAKDSLQAARDKSNFDAGARFTRAYWMRQYGYDEADLAADAPAQAAALPTAAAAFAQPPSNAPEAGAAAPPPVAAAIDALDGAAAPEWDALVSRMRDLVAAASDLGQLQQRLVEAFGGLDTQRLEALMAAAFALAELAGIAAVREAPAG